MSYHKENLKEQLAEIAFEICEVDSWQKVNMRLIAQKAGVSTSACYRHFTNKNDIKAEVMRRGFHLLYEGIEDFQTNNANFSSYGAHYVRFGLGYPHIYDLIFGNTYIDMNLYPDLEALSNASFDGLVEGVKFFMPNKTQKEILIKAHSVWASVHGIVGILRRFECQPRENETLEWIKENIEDYLEMTIFPG